MEEEGGRIEGRRWEKGGWRRYIGGEKGNRCYFCK